MLIRPRRSVLYMPGSNARAHEKAKKLAADALIFDLEDSVPPESKDNARDVAANSIKGGGYRGREIVLRINAAGTQWYKQDLAAVAAAPPDAVLIPKVSSPGDVMRTAKDLREAGLQDNVRLWAMMETPLAILNADSILRTAADPASRFDVVVMGTNDLAKEIRARLQPGRAALLPHLAICIAAARAHGVDIIDGVFNDFSDCSGFRAECEQAVDFGMDGKTLIHPSQIDVCNEVFTPPDDAIAWAHKVLAIFAKPENADKGVLQIDGSMVERLHLETARRTLAIAKAVGRLPGQNTQNAASAQNRICVG
ncbi:MAG: HpcH/HpaI aldolase/citrate lyase family protein [Beijerinckiaceae bacterium]